MATAHQHQANEKAKHKNIERLVNQVNKSELVTRIMENRPQDFKSRAAAERTVNAVFSEIANAVAAGDEVGIVGFGTFKAVDRAERTARNPQTGEELIVPAHVAPVFHAGSAFKEKVNA